MRIETGQEEDGRWVAKVASVPGALVYGATKKEAVAKVEALVLRILGRQGGTRRRDAANRGSVFGRGLRVWGARKAKVALSVLMRIRIPSV